MRSLVDGSAFPFLWVVALALSGAAGWFLSRKKGARAPGLFEGGVLAVTAVLLAAGWLAAYQAHLWRTSLVHDEADDLSAAYRFSTLLPQEDRKWLRSHLMAYVDAKLRFLEAGGQSITRTQPELVKLHGQMWDHLAHLQLENDYPRQQCIEALDRLIKVHFRRQYAYGERLPGVALSLMAVGCLASAFVAGLSRARLAGVLTIVLLGGAFLNIVDLDNTLSGGVQTDYANLRNLRIFMFQDPG